MEQKEIIHHLKTRWQAVRRFEAKELRKKLLTEKLNQASATFELGKLLRLPSTKREMEVKVARERWCRLKDLFYGKGQN